LVSLAPSVRRAAELRATHTGAAKTLDPILARFLVDVSVMPMLTFAAPAPGNFAPGSGFNFSG